MHVNLLSGKYYSTFYMDFFILGICSTLPIKLGIDAPHHEKMIIPAADRCQERGNGYEGGRPDHVLADLLSLRFGLGPHPAMD
jgi:hypothetical protein